MILHQIEKRIGSATVKNILVKCSGEPVKEILEFQKEFRPGVSHSQGCQHPENRDPDQGTVPDVGTEPDHKTQQHHPKREMAGESASYRIGKKIKLCDRPCHKEK